MKRSPVLILSLAVLLVAAFAAPRVIRAQAKPVIVVQTAKGNIEIELDPASAPKSVERILELVKTNFYRGQRVHWVQTGVVQFGDPQSRDMTKVDLWGRGGSGKPIGVAELSRGPFVRGSVGFAYRTNLKPETADSQIFILTGPNPALNGKFAMLGKVISGLDVAEKLAVRDVIRNVTLKGSLP
ncbi:MAG: peptidylprolyl isomerase [Vicinamibacterales bacterium]